MNSLVAISVHINLYAINWHKCVIICEFAEHFLWFFFGGGESGVQAMAIQGIGCF